MDSLLRKSSDDPDRTPTVDAHLIEVNQESSDATNIIRNNSRNGGDNLKIPKSMTSSPTEQTYLPVNGRDEIHVRSNKETSATFELSYAELKTTRLSDLAPHLCNL